MAAGPRRDTDLKGDVKGVVELVKAYAKQETIGPLKHIARYLAYGVAGSVLLSIGLVLLALAGLRALQTETGSTFTGNWSWAPYFITLAATVVVIALTVSRVTAGEAKRNEDR